MSRVGQNPVSIPDGVEVTVSGGVLMAKGKLGTQTVDLIPIVAVNVEDGSVVLKPLNAGKRARTMWGTTRSLVNNAVIGVSEGFTRRLEVNGVGYRAQVQGKMLNLQLGYSHDIAFNVPEDIKIEIEGERGNVIAVSGSNKQRVGQVASEIRSFRKPEPYKGKGVKYADEQILRKEGKKK
ncbi:MAG: 50S ribosomal protein L6 [Alphaproteobacteria bacterium MarineAlpha4_Bin2]|nr:MAG: 50S ribosomal protein L6 [Alphaproteobacteria bacterium MarineAlpha4_Bin2]